MNEAIAALGGPRRRGRPRADAEKKANNPGAAPKKVGKKMSPAQRQAVSDRMKKYWAKRKANSVGVPKKAGEKKHEGMSAEARKRRSEGMKKWWAAHRKANKKE